MDNTLILLLINTLANLEGLTLNKDKQALEDIGKKMDKIIYLLEGRLKDK